MIIVDIDVIPFEKIYDFKLDEHVEISKLIEDICEILVQKEKCQAVKNPECMMLCKKDGGEILSANCTLSDCNIVSGNQLMLI